MKDQVIVRTYGQDRTFSTRQEAIQEVRIWCLSSEGSEQSRYTNVLCELLSGKTYCTDGEG